MFYWIEEYHSKIIGVHIYSKLIIITLIPFYLDQHDQKEISGKVLLNDNRKLEDTSKINDDHPKEISDEDLINIFDDAKIAGADVVTLNHIWRTK